MRVLRVPFVAVFLSLVAAAALQAQANPMAEMIEQWEADFNAGDYAAIAEQYTADAVRYPPGADPLEGRAAITAEMANYADLTIDLELVDTAMSGDLMTAWGTYALYARDGDMEEPVQHGPWMNLSVRGEDGTWRIQRDIWNLRIQPQP